MPPTSRCSAGDEWNMRRAALALAAAVTELKAVRRAGTAAELVTRRWARAATLEREEASISVSRAAQRGWLGVALCCKAKRV